MSSTIYELLQVLSIFWSLYSVILRLINFIISFYMSQGDWLRSPQKLISILLSESSMKTPFLSIFYSPAFVVIILTWSSYISMPVKLIISPTFIYNISSILWHFISSCGILIVLGIFLIIVFSLKQSSYLLVVMLNLEEFLISKFWKEYDSLSYIWSKNCKAISLKKTHYMSLDSSLIAILKIWHSLL